MQDNHQQNDAEPDNQEKPNGNFNPTGNSNQNPPLDNTAPLIRRVFAGLIDMLVVSFIAGFFIDQDKALEFQNEMIRNHFNFTKELAEQFLPFQMECLLTFIATFFALNVFLLASCGQTLGKWVMKIAIRNLNNQLPNIFHLLANRYLIQLVMLFVPFLNLVDLLFILFRQDRRSIHDMFAKTKVIDLRKAQPTTNNILVV